MKYFWFVLIIIVLVLVILYYRKYQCEKAQPESGKRSCNFWTGKPKKCSTCGQKINFNL